jgi:hypothetical protein
MSHHLDSPLARQDVRLDITDIYVFPGEVGTVLIMDVNNTISGPDAPKGFHPEARYEFRVDLDGNAEEDMAFRLTFGPRDVRGQQTVELRRLDGADARQPAATGTLLATGTTESVIAGADGLRLWAGPAPDPFYIDPTVLKAVGEAFHHGTKVDLSGWQAATAVNLFTGTQVSAIVLELPTAVFGGIGGEQGRIGVWGTTTLATDAGGWRPINRAGLPMIQPIFNPADSERASEYNTTRPSADRANYGALFAKLVAGVIAAHETATDPAEYGKAVANLVLPDILTYEIGTPATFGFALRNGRALTDDAATVMFSLATNSALSTGLTQHSTTSVSDQFPYLATAVTAGQMVRS